MLLVAYAGILVLGTIVSFVISRMHAHTWRRTAFETLGALTHASFVIAWMYPELASALGVALWPMLVLVLIWSVLSTELAMREVYADEWWQSLGATGAAISEAFLLVIAFALIFPAIAMGFLLCLRQLQ